MQIGSSQTRQIGSSPNRSLNLPQVLLSFREAPCWNGCVSASLNPARCEDLRKSNRARRDVAQISTTIRSYPVRGSGFNAKSKHKFILTTTAASPFSALLPQQQIDSRIENSMKEKLPWSQFFIKMALFVLYVQAKWFRLTPLIESDASRSN